MWTVDSIYQCFGRELVGVDSRVIALHFVVHISYMASNIPGNGHKPVRRSRSDSQDASSQDSQDNRSWLESRSPQPGSLDSGLRQDPFDADPSEQGYDFEFCDEDAIKKFECPICLLTCRDPLQTECGHHFCRACITKWCR